MLPAFQSVVNAMMLIRFAGPACSLSHRTSSADSSLPEGASVCTASWLLHCRLFRTVAKDATRKLPPGGSWLRSRLEKPGLKTEGERGIRDQVCWQKRVQMDP